jgi:predicted RNA-binding Zn ribbon-like protein
MASRTPKRSFPLHHGRVSLSFAGTVGDRGSTPVERLDAPDALVGWLVAAGVLARRVSAPDERTFAAALRLRENIANIVAAVVAGKKPGSAEITALNAVVRRWGSRPMLDPKTLVTREEIADPIHAALGRLARDAVELVGDRAERERLRACGLDACGSIFLTPVGRDRRWCSMARCGNRAKVAAFREREGSRGH